MMLQSSISYSKQMITWYNIVVGLLVEGEGRRHDALEASDWMDAYSRSFSQPTSMRYSCFAMSSSRRSHISSPYS